MATLREPTYRERVLNYINEKGGASGGELAREFAKGPHGLRRVMFTLLGLEVTNQITSYNSSDRVIYRPIR